MDKTVPAGAAYLLEFIGDTEAPKGYDTVYGNNQGKLRTRLTNMTLAEVQKAQPTWTRQFGSSASGRYQFMYETLGGLITELRLRLTQKLDSGLQDRLAFHLLRRRGYDAFVFGRITLTEFAKRLAQEWASLPVLAGTKGGSRNVKRGQSYYAGDGLNKALVSADKVEAVLEQVLVLHKNAPSAPQVKKTNVKEIGAAAVAVGAASGAVIADPSVVSNVSDSIIAAQPIIETATGLAAMGTTVLVTVIGVAIIVGIGYLVYKRLKK